jgi:hypothetical protein
MAALHAASISAGSFSAAPPALRPVANTFLATAAAILAETCDLQ